MPRNKYPEVTEKAILNTAKRLFLEHGYEHVTLQDIASLCDMFYIGGTKCGAVMGEALVITNPALK